MPAEWNGKGIIYRAPPVVVEACAGDCAAKPPNVLTTLDGHVAQLGPYRVVPLKNGAFEKNNVKRSFADNGQLESFSYGTESQLERIATTISETATSVESLIAQKRAADDAAAKEAGGAELKAKQAEKELLKAKADKIEQEQRLRDLGGTP